MPHGLRISLGVGSGILSVLGTNLQEFASKRIVLQLNVENSQGKESARRLLGVVGIMMKILALKRT